MRRTLAAIYARVSTDRQKKEQTVESQIDALRREADERGYELSEEYVFVDENMSGSRLDRPGLERLRDLASDGAFEVVLVCSPDRLARQYAYQVVVIEELQRAGCEVAFSNHGGGFGESPEERMLLQIQGVFAEYERALMQERTRRGKLFAARQGRLGWSQAPYGYRIVPKTPSTPGKLAVEETEAEVVRQMYRWVVEEELSSYAVAERLQGLGIPTRKGGPWAQSSASNILSNPVYKGTGYYNRTKKVDARNPRMARGYKDIKPGNLRSSALRPEEEWIPVGVPAIVDPETWELARRQLEKNRQRAPRNNKKHEYLLRSLLVCGSCGRRMVGNWTKTGGGRYVCKKRYPKSAPDSCEEGRDARVEEIEPLVWGYVKGLLSEPGLLEARYEEGKGDPAVEAGEEREKERIERKLKALAREIGRLIDAYQAEVIELSELEERRGRIEDHAGMLKERLTEIERGREDREGEIRLLEGVEEFCASIREALEEPSFEIKQKVLGLVVDRIVVEDSKVVVHHVVPTGPVGLQTGRHLVERDSVLRCQPPGEDAVTTDIGKVRLFDPPDGAADVEGKWLPLESLEGLLAGNEVPADGLVSPLGTSLHEEPKVGLARDTRRRAAVEGMLYTILTLRAGDSAGFAVGIRGLPPEARRPELLKWGGEGRFVWSREMEAPTTGTHREEVVSRIDQTGRFRLVFLQPALFDGGWLPAGFGREETESGVRWRGELAEMRCTLVSAALGKARRIGGWDMKCGRPHPLKPHVPAGSVYFFETGAAGDSVVEALDGAKVGRHGNMGFGHVLVGGWR